jgi:hypothetical protein
MACGLCMLHAFKGELSAAYGVHTAMVAGAAG